MPAAPRRFRAPWKIAEHQESFVVTEPLILRVAAVSVALLSTYFAVRSLWLGLTLLSQMPYYDQWSFVHIEYALFMQGAMPLELLFRQTMEHRIFTTRLILLADAAWFDMRGYLPLFLSYASLAGVAVILTPMAVQGSLLLRAVAFALLLAIAWSISQWEVVGWAYEVFFPLQHLLALIALLTLAKAITANRWTWLAPALLCDFLTVWSSASGLFLTGAFALLIVWLRPFKPRVVLAFAAGHALIVASFFIGYQFWVKHPVPPPMMALDVLIGFLGWPFKEWGIAPVVGWLYLAAFLFIAAVMTKRAFAGQIERDPIILVAFAAFIFIEGVSLAYARPYNGVMDRHATMPILFTVAMIAICWRLLSHSALRWAMPAWAALAIVAASHPAFERQWRDRAAFLDQTIAYARAGDYRDDWMKTLCPDNTHWLKEDIELLRRQRVGPFAQ